MNRFRLIRRAELVSVRQPASEVSYPLLIALFTAYLLVSGCGRDIQRPVVIEEVDNRPASSEIPPTKSDASVSVKKYALKVNLIGQGGVSAKAPGSDFKCMNACNTSFDDGAKVILVAHELSGWKFTGWSGACSGNAPCVLSMKSDKSITANFTQSWTKTLNCTGKWEGSEETPRITAWPYRDCFRTDPIANRRIRLTKNAGADVVWDQGRGWNGESALRVRPPDGSKGRHQGFAGLGEMYFHDVRTKRLNIRYLFRYNGHWARYAQFTKWEIAIKYDYSDPTKPVRIKGCDRGMVIGRVDPSSGHKDVSMSQGVCTSKESVRNKSGWYYGPKVRENEWISIENEFDLETGWYRTYITTQDGVYNESLHTEINIGKGDYGAPAERVPSPYWWGSIDCSAGCFWGWPDDMGIVPRPEDTYIWYSHFVMSNQRIGPPAGFVQGRSSRND